MKTRSDSTQRPTRSSALAWALCLALTGATLTATSAGESPTLDIERSVILSWPDPGTNDNVVVSAPSPGGPYVPCLEPAFRRLDRLAVAVPVVDGTQFYQLKKGGLLVEPCEAYNSQWTIHNPLGGGPFSATSTNGSLRIWSAKGVADKWILWPPVPPPFVHGDMDYTDFATSVDILGWDGMTSTSFGHIARAYYHGEDRLYLGIIGFQNNAITELVLEAHVGVFPTGVVKSVPVRSSAKAHRLVFTGGGSLISLRLYALDRLTEPVASIVVTNTAVARGFPGGLWMNANSGSSSFDITLDNLVIVGTRPE